MQHPILVDSIFIATALLRTCSSLAQRWALLTDSNLAGSYGKQLQAFLQNAGVHCSPIVIPAGEQSKSREMKTWIEDFLFESSFNRDSGLLTLGGGVVTDLGGFVAATFCRGIPYISIPTTLLGMIDASIGGKTAVNTPYGKNLIGALYFPKAIFLDINLLQTLPQREYLNGIVETIKHALIADISLWDLLMTQYEGILNREPAILRQMINASAAVKLKVVQADPQEQGLRCILNFGHTVGHAIEKVTDYAISHGEAVALGMIAEAFIAQKLGYLSQKDFDELLAIYSLYPLVDKSIAVAQFWKDFPALWKAMARDKKAAAGSVRLTMLERTGSCASCSGAYCSAVDRDIVKEALCYTWELLAGE